MCVSERYFEMTVSPFTLNNLYSQGILDYAPYDLCNSGVNVSSLNGISNPYLSSAMRGNLYQNYNKLGDSFSYSSPYMPQEIGANSQAGLNAWGMGGIGTQSQVGSNAWGGFGDVSRNVDGAISFFDRIPKPLKGILAGVLMFGSIALALKNKKKPPVSEKLSFLRKLNPMNWFKKNKKLA